MAVNLNRDTPELAAAYDTVSDMQFASGLVLLDKLEITAGDAVLDIGCGTGRLGRHVLTLVGPCGRFIGIDPLAERIKIAREKNVHANAVYHIGVAEDLGLVDTVSIDVVYLNWVFHWVAGKEAALREIARVLRPGGRLGIVLPSKDLVRQGTMNQIIDAVLAREPYRSSVRPEDAPQRVSNPPVSELVRLLANAGLSVEEIQIKHTRWTYPSAAGMMTYLEASYFGNNLNNVPAALRDQARADILAEFVQLETAVGVIADHNILYAVAVKAAGKKNRRRAAGK